jgi:hypothetical protein
MKNSKKLVLNLVDTIHIYFYIFREIIVNYIFYKLKLRRFLGRGRINNVSGILSSDFYDKGIKHFNLISKTLNKNAPHLRRDRFLELGPGGTLLNGFMLTHGGWREYYAVDAFPSEVWSKYPQHLYHHYIKSLRKKNDRHSANKILRTSMKSKGPLFYFSNGGVHGEGFASKVKNNSVDFIYSWGVLEHIENPKDIFDRCFSLLKSNGCSLHVIDFHPHTWHRFYKTHYFLAIPDWLWYLMYNKRGFINRLRASAYLNYAKSAGFSIKILKKEYSKSDISGYRKNFQKKFKKLKANDILTDRIYMLLTKP